MHEIFHWNIIISLSPLKKLSIIIYMCIYIYIYIYICMLVINNIYISYLLLWINLLLKCIILK